MIPNKLRASLIAFSSVIALSTAPLSAQEESSSEKATPVEEGVSVENAFAQCGIGAAIFPKNATAATFSNAIWDFGTTAFSSQTSSPSSCSGATKTAAAFINETYPVLEEQFVKGSGSHVAALMEIMQCDTNAQSTFVISVQNELIQSFADGAFLAGSQNDRAKMMGGMVDRAMVACNA